MELYTFMFFSTKQFAKVHGRIFTFFLWHSTHKLRRRMQKIISSTNKEASPTQKALLCPLTARPQAGCILGKPLLYAGQLNYFGSHNNRVDFLPWCRPTVWVCLISPQTHWGADAVFHTNSHTKLTADAQLGIHPQRDPSHDAT